jgi:hypothetical protein
MTATVVDAIAAVTGREDLGGVTVATAVGTTTTQRPHRRRNLLLHLRPHPRPHRFPMRMTATVVDAIAAVTDREDLGGVTVATAVGTTTAQRPHRRRNLLLHLRPHPCPHRFPMRMTAMAEDATVAATGRAVLAGVTVATAVGTTTAQRPHRRRNPLLHQRPRPYRLQMRRTAMVVDGIAVGTASLMGDAMARRGITVRTRTRMGMDRTGRTPSRPICWICRMAGATVGKVVRTDRDPDGVSVTT